MKSLLIFLFSILLANSFVCSQSDDWDEFKDLIEKKHRPNEARLWLIKKLNTSVLKNNIYDVNRCFNSFLVTTSAMEDLDRQRLFFQLDSLSRTLPKTQRNLSQITLMKQLSSGSWFSYQMMSKPIIVGKDTFLLKDRRDLYEFIYKRLEVVEEDRAGLEKIKLTKEFSYFTGELMKLPTAYDYVSYELISLYSSHQLTRWIEPDFGYSVDTKWLSNSKDFQNVEIEKSSFLSRVISLYQDLERINENDFEIVSQFHYLRLKQLDNYYTNEEMKNAFRSGFDQYEQHSYRSKFLLEIALFKYREGLGYHFQNAPENEPYILEAYEMLLDEKKKFPKSNVIDQIDASVELIEKQEVQAHKLNNMYPGDQIPLKLSYRNIDTVQVFILKENSDKPLNNRELFQNLNSNNYAEVYKRTMSLPNKKMMQKRSLETLLPALNTPSNYLLLILPKGKDWKNLNKGSGNWGDVTASFSKFQVTQITAAMESSSEGVKLIVTDYNTGKPINNAKVDIYYSRFSELLESIPVKKGSSDSNGFYETKLKDFQSYNCKIRYKDSEIILGGYSSGSSSSKPINSVALFTDRSIYRPGQKLYFKAIQYMGSTDKNEFKVVPNKSLKVNLYDANYQLIESKEVNSNPFGSISGVFNLPFSSPLGRYSIAVHDSKGTYLTSHSFTVEEYKRPTFQVKIEQPKNVVKLEDSVSVYGDVIAFAGFPLTDANVRFSVYREPTYFWWYRPRGYSSESEIMETGEIKTDDQGRFKIDFLASGKSKNNEESFNFSIEAEVTDLSGETQKSLMSIRISKTGLFLNYEGTDKYTLGSNGKAKINLQNSFGAEQASKKGVLTLYRRADKERFLSRIWTRAEYQQFDTLEWQKLFPYHVNDNSEMGYDELFNIDDYEIIKEVDFSTNESFELDELFAKLKSGAYHIKAFVVENTDTVFLNKSLDFTNNADKDYKKSIPLWVSDNYIEGKVGEDVSIRFGTGFEEANILVEVYSGYDRISSEWRKINGSNHFKVAVKEENRGGMAVLFYTVKNGVRYYQNVSIGVPFDNKKLEVEAMVFRDKLYPGQGEEWSFKVKNLLGKENEAEILASMYDASLDEFIPHSYSFWPYRNKYNYFSQSGLSSKSSRSLSVFGDWRYYYFDHFLRNQTSEIYGGVPASYGDYSYKKRMAMRSKSTSVLSESMAMEAAPADMDEEMVLEEVQSSAPLIDYGDVGVEQDDRIQIKEQKGESGSQIQSQPQIRKNFDETAFFYPHLKTNENGEVIVSFTLPESLTKWNFKAFAHTKDIKIGSLDLTAVAQKDLMIAANAPRFFRRGDRAIFSSRLTNLSENDLDVNVELTFFNPVNEKEIKLIKSKQNSKKVNVKAGGNKAVEWEIDLKDAPDLIAYKIIAKSKGFSDGEQKMIPVLSNRQFVTEAFPFVTVGAGNHKFTFENFKNNNSSTLEHYNFSLEYTANPIWNVVLALPYMTDYPYECAEQVFTRFFANTLAAQVIGKKPELQKTLEIWKNHSPEVFVSELNKNEELKTVLLEETPWVVKAQNEEEQRKRVVELFDMNTLKNNLDRNLALLTRKQNSDGGFGWFGGNRSNLYITQHIVSGFGYLKQLGVEFDNSTEKMIRKAIDFTTKEYLNAYQRMTKKEQENLSVNRMVIHWLYTLSFFETDIEEKTNEMLAKYRKSLEENWMNFGLQEQALAGIYFKRTKGGEVADLIYKSLQDRSKFIANKGRFFPENGGGYYWQSDKIGTHSMLLTFYKEMKAPTEEIEELRLWLLLNKRSNHWGHTKNTAMATYAMLLSGNDFTSDHTVPTVKIGGKTVMNEQIAQKGKTHIPFMGYFKQSWSKSDISKELAALEIEKTSTTPSYGAMYWQYFEDIDKVEESANPDIDVTRKYELVVAGQKGKEYKKAKTYKVGDRIRVTLTFETQNDLEYVHLKDLRPSGFEPLESLSRHHWDQGLWYYQSPRDASMNFFIDRLPRGSYTLTYEVFATAKGSFSAGNTTIQCMYAPEMVGHSKGESIDVGN